MSSWGLRSRAVLRSSSPRRQSKSASKRQLNSPYSYAPSTTPLAEWVLEESINSWSPGQLRKGDSAAARFCTPAAAVSEHEAKQFLTAAEQLMGHMTDVLTKTFPASDADPTASA